jgi:hypothetical protein
MPGARALLFAFCVASLFACTRDHGAAADAAADVCIDVVRTAGDDDARVFSAGLDGKASPVDVTCEKATCLHDSATAVAVVTRAHKVWAAWAGHAGAWLDTAASDATADDERWARRQALAGDDVAPPPPDDEMRTCGTTTAGGGFGWHIIRNRDNVWQGIRWDKPPTAPEVARLAPDQYPLATPEGALCAYATQSPPRAWHVHLLGQAHVVVDAEKDREHPHAYCVDATHVAVFPTSCASKTFDEDGVEQPSSGHATEQTPHQVDGSTAVIARPGASFAVLRGDGHLDSVALPVDRDLSGGPITAGAVRERVLVRGGKDGTMLVAERFVGPDCSRREALTVLDAEHRGTLVREGDVVFGRFGYAGERFYWVEAKPHVEIVR